MKKTIAILIILFACTTNSFSASKKLHNITTKVVVDYICQTSDTYDRQGRVTSHTEVTCANGSTRRTGKTTWYYEY